MKKRNEKQFLFRLRCIFAFVASIGFVLIANLFYIQISNGHRFRAQADGQYVVATYNSFERGSIYFEQQDGTKISAAGQRTGYKISINPSNFNADADEVSQTISDVIEFDDERFRDGLSRSNRTYFEIANNVSKEDGIILKEALGSAISLHAEKWRVYPLKGSAAHALGFLGYQGDELAGRYGLERQYESTLKREDVDVYTNFFARIFHNVQNFVDPEKVPEGDIVTTIDPQVQLYFENQLKGIQSTWNSESVAGIIMNPKNGEIYAMGAFPNFDNNNFRDAKTEYFKNPLVENVHEFGSIVKPLIVGIAIDNENIDHKELEYYDSGSVEVGPHTISNFDGRGRGWVSVQEILNQSLNTGMVHIAEQIPKPDFREYFEKFGFTSQTNIDLPNEGTNLTNNLKSNRDIEFANMSFGQGIAVTPISMIQALGTLANRGKTVQPHLVKKIEYTNGFSKTFDYEVEQQIALSEDSAGEVSRMLVNAFDAYRNGTVKLDNYSVAAKTGTAQIPNPQGGYYDDRNLHSFVGYFPAYDPEFIILMYTVHPKGVKYASQTLIDPFVDVTKYLINYYKVAPDR
ncbi:MAG: penicillin-binding protein 2 [Candidatus Pacebacteria bacterium]|nr:penicillin-binding protein 2 [Candidatus Paceibacterota bacterium]